MILGFNKKFVEPIKKGTKIHTIREDSHNRWKLGMKIHFATGVRSSRYYNFMMGRCLSTQAIRIVYVDEPIIPQVYVDNSPLKNHEVWELARNDGFETLAEFFDWFNQDFSGKIIHWTDFKYV